MVAGAGQGPSEKSSFILFFVVAFHLTTLFDDFVAARSSFWRGLAGAVRKVIFYVVFFLTLICRPRWARSRHFLLCFDSGRHFTL